MPGLRLGLPIALPHTVQVSGKVLGGSDLFLQGVLAPQGGLPDFLAGSPRALCVPGQPIPFAGARVRGRTLVASMEGGVAGLTDSAQPRPEGPS